MTLLDFLAIVFVGPIWAIQQGAAGFVLVTFIIPLLLIYWRLSKRHGNWKKNLAVAFTVSWVIASFCSFIVHIT
ncbi:MAG: hypothetical protein AB7L92_00535 [Alphaproteobacteria bacterium]